MSRDKNKDFINKLYINPLETITSNWGKSKGFRLKGEILEGKPDNIALRTLPNLRFPGKMGNGNVIMQNWETKKDIPSDIGELIHYPVLMDRTKYKQQVDPFAKTLPNLSKINKNKQSKTSDNKKLLQTVYGGGTKAERLRFDNEIKTVINTEVKSDREGSPSQEDMVFRRINEPDKEVSLNELTDRFIKTKYKEPKKSRLIDFSTFDKHLYLRDNDFLYAKRVGGPVDFVLCNYQEINKKAKISSNHSKSVKGKKILPSIKRKKFDEYITISKNTVLHYIKGVPSLYSIQEWIENYEKYKTLMKISLFKNFKNAKLFDLWKRFYHKTRRQYYTEKLRQKLFLVDTNLLNGILDSRNLLKEMKLFNILHFERNTNDAVLLNQFNELHKTNLVRVDKRIENYRTRVKLLIVDSCNKSYQEYKTIKKITLDDNATTSTNTNKKQDNTTNPLNKQEDGSNIQNFIKDAIPYAQDATRKTHYKKLLKYIRVMDYIFNEAKYEVINFSLDQLAKRFKRLYDCYVNKWLDSPILITKILCMSGKIYYNPSIKAMSETFFENFIQETIYCVIYKKNFMDPQEFPRYMSCFEEVFEISVDQNSNLNKRIKQTDEITGKLDSIKYYFDLCHKELEKTIENLRPLLENYQKNENINFNKLKETASPAYLKDLLDDFREEEKNVKALKPVINIGIFEFQIDDLVDLISEDPKKWIEKMKRVIPAILLDKVKKNTFRMKEHLRDLSINPIDVESFIKLKKAVEACNKEKDLHESNSNEILDLQNIIDTNKDIKIPEFDNKFIIELKNVSVQYDRKLDSVSYYIDNNIVQFRAILKNEIKKFDTRVKDLTNGLNNDELNTYNEDTYSAIDFLEENSIQIKKCLESKKKFQQQEDDLEIDSNSKSNFENLELLVYEQELKENLWNSVKEFQEKSREWEKEQVFQINLESFNKSIKSWLDLCKVAIVDIDIPHVPMELQKKVEKYEQISPVVETIQNPNVNGVNLLFNLLCESLGINIKQDDPLLTLGKIMSLPDIYSKLPEIKELNFRGNEEKRLKDLIKSTNDSFYPRKIPIKMKYVKEDIDKEFEFVEENVRMLNKVYLNKYSSCILKELEILSQNFSKYQKFLLNYVNFQKYLKKSEGIMESQEFIKEMPAEHKKLMSENAKKNLYKEIGVIQKFLEHGFEKAMASINSIILSYEQNYKSIDAFFNKKRKEIPRYYLLTNDDLNRIYQERESPSIRETMLYKIYPWIKKIIIGYDQDEHIRFITNDDENIVIKYSKTSHSLKDLIEFIDSFLIKKLKENFKTFKKEYETSTKSKSTKKPKEVINDLLANKDNLAQGIFNCMFYYSMDCLEKALFTPDESFDKLFDLYNEIKEDKIPSFIKKVKEEKLPVIQKRIIINIISLENYIKSIIENLIREDVNTSSDYNFCKLIIPKVENDTYMLHFFNYQLEYGYDYVGLHTNFLIFPEFERMFISFSNAIYCKKPFHLYGIQETGKKEILGMFAKLCGKRITYVNVTANYDINAFNKIYYGNSKNEGWICIDQTQYLKYELLQLISGRIMEIYRIIHSKGDNNENVFEDGEKVQVNASQVNIFLYRDISDYKPFNPDSISKIIKSYYRQIGMPYFDVKNYLFETLNNFSIEKSQEITNKIAYSINYALNRISIMKKSNIQLAFITKIIAAINKKLINNDSTELNLFTRNLLKEIFDDLLNQNEKEKEDFRKFLNEVFEMKEYVEEVKPEEQTDPLVSEMIKKQLLLLKINSENYENQINSFYNAVNKFNNFVLVGPPLSGKSNLVALLNLISKQLNAINKTKYSKFINVRIFPKSKTPDELFSENKVEKAYRTDNNFFYNMISLFDEENEELLMKLNDHYNDLLTYKLPEVEEELTPEKLNKKFQKEREEDRYYDEDNDGGSYAYQKEEESDNEKKAEKKIKMLIFDGSMDDTWLEYINNIYDNDNFLTLANGYKLNFREDYKMIFETTNLRNTPPSFLTHQILISCNYENYGWEAILHTWIESNPKITENSTLKNYIKGLFENYFPRVSDFIDHNKMKNIDIGNNYYMKSLINIFESIFPMFNFEDVKIGRRNYNVMPKIELIKRCTLSIFIFSCAWAMNLLSNFVIKTKIEKLISDIFKADDLKGPIFDYYIEENSNDFESWQNLLKDPDYTTNFGDKNQMAYYGKIFVHTSETVPYTWLCDKFIDACIPFYFNGRPLSGKSALLNDLMFRKSEDYMEIRKLKMVCSYYTRPEEVENFIFSNVTSIKRDLYGDKFMKETCLYVDDLNINVQKDKYGTSNLLEYLRGLTANKFAYDSKNNESRYLKKFNVLCCGNITCYPYDEEFNRFISQFLLVTFSTNEDYFLSIFKPSLEIQLRKYIPNTSGITSGQYIQVCLKLNQLLKGAIKQVPSKLHILFNINDTIQVLNSINSFKFTGDSEYPDYLKKLFFYESSMIYGSKLNRLEDLEIFREKICEAYSSVFKQDKVKKDTIFDEKWRKGDSYIFCKDYNNFNNEKEEMKDNHCFLSDKNILFDFIKSKIDLFYRAKDIKDKTYIKITNENLDIIVKILRFLENNNHNLLLIGKTYASKRALLSFSTYISEIDFVEVDSTFSNEFFKTKEVFINSVINPFLIKATQQNKKCLLYIPPYIKAKYVLEVINKLVDIKEIHNNFNFLNSQENEGMTEEEAIEKLEKNISFCFDIIPGTESYLVLFTRYMNIVKNSTVIYFHSWDKEDMKTYFNISIKEININLNEKMSNKLSGLLIDIFDKINEIYQEFYKRTGIELYLDQKNFCYTCEFYSKKYKEYKTILEERQKKYNDNISVIDKTNASIEKINTEINDSAPKRKKLEKSCEQKKEELNKKLKDKNVCRTKKQQEDKIVSNLVLKLKEKQYHLDIIFSPHKDSINKAINIMSKLGIGDITEVKNTWDTLNFGKFLLSKIYELFGEEKTDWDSIKKTLEIKIIKNLINITPEKASEKFISIAKEITSHNDFSLSDNKYQKPFKVCKILCEYFSAFNNYFIARNGQKKEIDEVNDLKKQVEEHKKNIKQFLQEATQIDNDIQEIEKAAADIDNNRNNLSGYLLKLNELKNCFTEYVEILGGKINIWKTKKINIDIILENYDFYLLYITCYLLYAAPLNKSYRKIFKKYLFSLAKKLELKNIKEFTLCGFFLEIFDCCGKDNEFCSAIYQYPEFLADNFIMIYIMKYKIPYLIDKKRVSMDIISKFLEFKSQKGIVKTVYNDISETGEMFEKIEFAMKNGNILFIDQCEENIYDIMENYINNKYTYNPKTGRDSYLIKNKKIDKDPNFKLFLIKSKNTSIISSKAFSDCYVINFNCPADIITEIISTGISLDQDPEKYKEVKSLKIDIVKNTFKLTDSENKIMNLNKLFDLGINLDKLENDKNILDKLKLEIQTHDMIENTNNKMKKRLEIESTELNRYNHISFDSSQLFKWCIHFFNLNNLYIIPIEYLVDIAKEFYKNKYGTYKDLVKRDNKKPSSIMLDENGNEIRSDKKFDDDKDEESEESEDELKKEEEIENEIPTYTKDDIIEYVIFVYNEICQIYDITQRSFILLVFLFYALSKREDISRNYKDVLYSVYKIFFKKEMDTENYKTQSPIHCITDEVWNALKEINDNSTYCLSLILDHIERNKEQWELYLDDENIIAVDFKMFDENLESSLNPFVRFILFSVIKPNLSDSLINSIINEIIKNEENEKIEKNIKFHLSTIKPLLELLDENLSLTRRPILLFINENDNLNLEKEVKDYYLPSLLKSTNNNENKKEEPNNAGEENNERYSYKEIIPTKSELSNSDLDIIHSYMRAGGVIGIRNCQLIKDSLLKFLEELREKSTVLNENFRLILIVNSNNLLPSYLYLYCNIFNHDISILRQMKQYIINLIRDTPNFFYNKFINGEYVSNASFYFRKLYILFLIINAVLVQYVSINPRYIKIPINYCKKDFLISLRFLDKYLTSLSEDKLKELNNADNLYFFTYESLIKIVFDSLICSRLIYKEDYNKLNKILTLFLEGERFLRETDCLFRFDEFEVNTIDEKLYPVLDSQKNTIGSSKNITSNADQKTTTKNTNTSTFKYFIPKSAIEELFEKIPNERYYELLQGTSIEMINDRTGEIIKNFYNIACKNKEISKNKMENALKHNEDLKISNALETLNINSVELIKALDKIKNSLPDQLNITDANPALFKLNKFNEYFNPLDECLQTEIDNYNKYLSDVTEDITNIYAILQGDMILISKYYYMIVDLNRKILPDSWKINKKSKDIISLENWISKLKYRFDTINEWILNGTLKVFDLSIFSDIKLFMIMLPLYFHRRIPDELNVLSSERIRIYYKLTKFEKKDEITEEVLAKIKEENNKQDFILINGLRLHNFVNNNDKEIRTYKENLNKPEGEKLPLILVSYYVEQYQLDSAYNAKEAETINNEEELSETSNENNDIPDGKSNSSSILNVSKSKDMSKTVRKSIDVKDSKSNIKVNYNMTTEMAIRRLKSKVHKKYCRLEIPFVDGIENDIYSLNDPLGYIELRFECTKDKQDDYFINNKIMMVIDS